MYKCFFKFYFILLENVYMKIIKLNNHNQPYFEVMKNIWNDTQNSISNITHVYVFPQPSPHFDRLRVRGLLDVNKNIDLSSRCLSNSILQARLHRTVEYVEISKAQ